MMTMVKRTIGIILILTLLLSTLAIAGVFNASAASTIPSGATTLVDFGQYTKDKFWTGYGSFVLEKGSTFGDNSQDVAFTSNNTDKVTEHQFGSQGKVFDPALLTGKGTIGVLVYIDAASDLAKFNVKLDSSAGTYQYCVSGITKDSVQLVELPLYKFKSDSGMDLVPEDYSKLSGKVTISSGWNAQWLSDTDHPNGWNKPTGGSYKIKWGNMFVYGTPYVAPTTTYRSTAEDQPAATTIKPSAGSKNVISFKTWNKDFWVNDLKTGPSQIIDTAAHPITDENGNSFPSDWGAFRVERNSPDKTAMQFQLGWNSLEKGVLTGADGVRAFVLFEPDSKQNDFTVKLNIPAVDDKGNPIMVNGKQRVDVYLASTSPQAGYKGYDDSLVTNDDSIYYVFLSWDLFKIDDASKVDVPHTLTAAQVPSATQITIAFGYAWTADGKGNSGPLGYISDIWTYKDSDIPPTTTAPLGYDPVAVEEIMGIFKQLPPNDSIELTDDQITLIEQFFNAYTNLDKDTKAYVDETYSLGEEYMMYYFLCESLGIIGDGSGYTPVDVSNNGGTGNPVVTGGMAPVALLVIAGAAGVVLYKSRKKEY